MDKSITAFEGGGIKMVKMDAYTSLGSFWRWKLKPPGYLDEQVQNQERDEFLCSMQWELRIYTVVRRWGPGERERRETSGSGKDAEPKYLDVGEGFKGTLAGKLPRGWWQRDFRAMISVININYFFEFLMRYPLPFLGPHKYNYFTQQNAAKRVWEIEGCRVQRQKSRVRTWQKPFDTGSSAAPSEDGSEDDHSSPPHLLWDPRKMKGGRVGLRWISHNTWGENSSHSFCLAPPH